MDVRLIYDVEGDVHVGGTLLGERCTYSGAGPGSPYQGLEWVVRTARA